MAPVFIFAEHVKEILKSGKKEIEIPAGTRVSAAARDLIRDNKIRLTYLAAGKPAEEERASEVAEKPAGPAENPPDVQGRSESGGGESESPRAAAGEIPEDVLEEIVDRVIERFRQRKGLKSETPAAKGGAPTDSDAVASPDDDLVICRCEEITRGEIREAIKYGMHTLNGIKRVTRAGMGLCQGQTCQRLVARILTEELGLAPADIDPTTARGPVRPLRLEVFANS